MRLIAISFTIGLVVSFLSTGNGAYPVLITFYPAATLIAKYVEVIKRGKIKEAVLIISVIGPFVLLFFEGFLK